MGAVCSEARKAEGDFGRLRVRGAIRDSPWRKWFGSCYEDVIRADKLGAQVLEFKRLWTAVLCGQPHRAASRQESM